MTKNDNPRLCGGTFFTLLLQDLKERKKAREHYKGERDGLSDPEVLIGLIKVINPDYEGPDDPMSLKGKANDYKSCKTSTGAYLPFGPQSKNKLVRDAFDERIRNNYHEALKDMTAFVNDFLEVGKSAKRDEFVVKALIDLISQDDSTDGASFYIEENGVAVEKSRLIKEINFCYPAFLLGVWHFIVEYRDDNKIGQPTYDAWCPSRGGAERIFQSDIGSGITRRLNVYMPDQVEDAAFEGSPEDVVFDFGDEDADTDSGDTSQSSNTTPPPMQQIIQNPLIIQQYGPNSSVMPNYGTMHIKIGGDKKDE